MHIHLVQVNWDIRGNHEIKVFPQHESNGIDYFCLLKGKFDFFRWVFPQKEQYNGVITYLQR